MHWKFASKNAALSSHLFYLVSLFFSGKSRKKVKRRKRASRKKRARLIRRRA